MVNRITNNDISAAKSTPFAVVDFSATWCGPCNMLAPVIDELSEQLGDVAFYSADVDENPELAEENSIQNIPALLFLKNGTAVGSSVGFLPKQQLEAKINSYR